MSLASLSLALALALAAAVTLSGCAGASPPAAPVDDVADVVPLAPDTSPIGLRRSVVADQYFWLRAKVLEGEGAGAVRRRARRDARSARGAGGRSDRVEDLDVRSGR